MSLALSDKFFDLLLTVEQKKRRSKKVDSQTSSKPKKRRVTIPKDVKIDKCCKWYNRDSCHKGNECVFEHKCWYCGKKHRGDDCPDKVAS